MICVRARAGRWRRANTCSGDHSSSRWGSPARAAARRGPILARHYRLSDAFPRVPRRPVRVRRSDTRTGAGSCSTFPRRPPARSRAENLRLRYEIAADWVAANPTNWRPHEAYAVALMESGDLAGAQRELGTAAQLVPRRRAARVQGQMAPRPAGSGIPYPCRHNPCAHPAVSARFLADCRPACDARPRRPATLGRGPSRRWRHHAGVGSVGGSRFQLAACGPWMRPGQQSAVVRGAFRGPSPVPLGKNLVPLLPGCSGSAPLGCGESRLRIGALVRRAMS
jgi:hypothetical protein